MPCVAHGSGPARPALEVADIFRTYGPAYRREHVLSPDQRAVMRAIETCRTAVRGGHLDVCTACGHQRPAYNSCRNRHCPKCQALRAARWLDQRRAQLLPTDYFHVVFTVPAALRPLALRHRRRVFAVLLRAAAQTLLTLGRNPARLGAHLGVTSILHTWTRDLQFHPHVHCLVTAGGLALTGDRWVPSRRRFLFPVRVLGRLFRGKVFAALAHAHRTGSLPLPDAAGDDRHAFVRWAAPLARSDWVVYAKRPFAGPAQVIGYLGRYTHRVGLANQRLQAIDAAGIRFATKHGRSITLAPAEFLRRFLLHVLPAGFVKIRHAGLFAPHHVRTTLPLARQLLPAPAAPSVVAVTAPPAPDWITLLRTLTGVDVMHCPQCHRGVLQRQPLPATPSRAPPVAPRA